MENTVISYELAKFYGCTTYDNIPYQITEKAKRHILDTFGAGLAGALSDESKKICSVYDYIGRREGSAALWGMGKTADPLLAALANGVACHAFELDDTGGCDHSGAVVIPAAIAALSLCGERSGKEFLTAVISGYDIARRALEACGAYEPHNEAGWHSTSTCGSFGAAVAAGSLLRLSVTEMQSAIGIAASMSGGLWAFIHDGAQTKRLHPGRAAEGGLLAALLAKQGFRGPHLVMEDVWGGFTRTFAPQSEDRAAWLRDLGENWKMGRVSIKPYTSCRSTHAAMDTVRIIQSEHSLSLGEIDKIIVEVNPFVFGMCGSCDLTTLTAAQMSMPYGMAAILVYGSAGLADYMAERRNDPLIKYAMDKIILSVNETMASDEEPIVNLHDKFGNIYSHRVDIPLGSPQNPLPDTALLEKFHSIASLLYQTETAEVLAKITLELENVTDMQEVLRILQTRPSVEPIVIC